LVQFHNFNSISFRRKHAPNHCSYWQFENGWAGFTAGVSSRHPEPGQAVLVFVGIYVFSAAKYNYYRGCIGWGKLASGFKAAGQRLSFRISTV
jgi:hypothetical protein